LSPIVLRLVCVAGAMLLTVSSGCLPKTEPSSVTLASGQSIEARQARAAIYELTNRLAGEIEQSSDEIRDVADDSRARRAALEWKVDAVPALQRAAFQPEPVLAFTDMWVFVAQMQDLFESDRGRDWLGPHAATAAATAHRLEELLIDFAISIGGDPIANGGAELVHEFARANPIRSSISARPSAAVELADRLRTGRIGTFAAVGSLVEGFADLSDRLTIYGDQLPRQVRWQAELLMFDKGLERIDVDALLADTARLGQLADHAMEFTDGLPALIDGRIAANMPLVMETLEQVELETIMRDADDIIGRQIAAALAVVESERELVLEAVREEREITMNEAEVMADRFLDDTFVRVETMLTEMAGRLLPLGLLVLAGPFVLGLVLGLALRRRPAA